MPVHGPNVHPILEVAASHEPPVVGQASSLPAAAAVHGPWAGPPDEETFHEPSSQVVDYKQNCPKSVHGPNVHPILEVAASHEPVVGQASSLLDLKRTGETPVPLLERRTPIRRVGHRHRRAELALGDPMALMVPVCIQSWRSVALRPRTGDSPSPEKVHGPMCIRFWRSRLPMNPGGADLPVSQGAEVAVEP